MKRRFQVLVTKLKKFISERCDLEEVVDVLLDYDRNKFLSDCKTLNELFEKIREYYSFYDYAVIKVLTNSLGSGKNKKELKNYKQKFREFWVSRICEIPNDAFTNAAESEKFKVKIDRSMEEIAGADIETLKHEMRRILGHKLQFLNAEEGCVQLIFRSYEPVLCLNKEQQLELRKAGVLSLSYGEEFTLEFDAGKL